MMPVAVATVDGVAYGAADTNLLARRGDAWEQLKRLAAPNILPRASFCRAMRDLRWRIYVKGN